MSDEASFANYESPRRPQPGPWHQVGEQDMAAWNPDPRARDAVEQRGAYIDDPYYRQHRSEHERRLDEEYREFCAWRRERWREDFEAWRRARQSERGIGVQSARMPAAPSGERPQDEATRSSGEQQMIRTETFFERS